MFSGVDANSAAQDNRIELYEFAQYVDAVMRTMTSGTQFPEIRAQGVRNYTLARM